MRIFTLVGIGCALGGAPAIAHAAPAARLLPAVAPETASAAVDTTARVRFHIPARPLTDALGEFSRQATVRVQVDAAAAAGARSNAVSGAYTPPEALRLLLEGSGLAARFEDGETVLVTRAGEGGDAVYALTAVTAFGGRSRGYVATRTTSATRTDTPLRDAPQAVSVVTAGLIADQSMQGMADVVRYVPGVTMGQGEGHRDAPTIRGNASTADFFVDGVRDDAQYLRDVYNVERVEALKGSNALVFGRGGGGGVINRVSKEAQWAPTRVFTAEGGSWDHKRTTVDLGQGVSPALAVRFNGMFEESGGFRDAAELQRFGLNPTVAWAAGARTTVRAGYELFSDDRTVDRGIPSFQGRPSPAGLTTFFGNPDLSYSEVRVHAAGATVDHAFGAVTVRNRTRVASYDKFYQNSFPGAVNAEGTQVNLAAYNNATDRRNLFNQTDVVFGLGTGPLRHTFLVGAELGRQRTENFRETGYYNDAVTSFAVPFDEPTVSTPITFRQSATDADNRATATVAGVYLQDQVAFSRHLQAVLGVRFDRFSVDFHNNRNDEDLKREDDLVSPRAGLVVKPVEPVSLYGSYSVSYLPSAGDQFSSLNATTETLEPERFTNYEAGAKWDALPGLALTAAVYRLDRTNTSAPDPNDPTRTVQTGSQRTTGYELGVSGDVTPRWQVVGGFASQDAEITSTTAAAARGQKVALVPERTLSLWNRYQLFPALGVGLGVVHQAEMFAAIDNSVTLPEFTRFDAAVFVRLNPLLSAQLNVENLTDETYYPTSHGNNNIMPGASRSLRLTLTTRR
ncbi:MAG TPA: TonB-dependent siderophore receptor [Longimicrobium sp.]|nr:TonB-dependent siderophore receptor [Longimicrobium sp.]